MALDLSVIIVSYNTRTLLDACLKSVACSSSSLSLETIVVDNASTDGSAEQVREHHPQVRLIRNPRNAGFAAATNQGISIAGGRYLLLLNSDTVVLEECLDRVVRFADAHPEAGAIGCRVLNPDRSLQPSCLLFPGLLNIVLLATGLPKMLPRSRLFGREASTWWSYDSVRDVDFVRGCFLLLRREAIERVGLLDERFFMYAEEADLCYRIRKAGMKVLFTPDAEIVHVGGASSDQTPRPMILQLWGSVLIFIRKHRSRPYYLACSAAVIAFFAIRVVPCMIVGLLSRSRGAAMRSRSLAYVSAIVQLVTRGADGLLLAGPQRI